MEQDLSPERKCYQIFEDTLRECFISDIRDNNDFCVEMWGALANVEWHHVKEPYGRVSYSFRFAGSLIANIRGDGDYMDWYCSGPSGVISEKIRRTLKKHGWLGDPTSDICDEPGCIKDVGCGWPSPTGYRMTCAEHWRDLSRKSETKPVDEKTE
jgi:hypothetical protein